MRSTAPAPRLLATAGIAFGGLIGGHTLGYLLAIPDPLHRSALVAATGHGYLPSLAWLAGGLGAAAVVAGIASGRHGQRGGSSFARRAAWMSAAQVTAFFGMEVVERLAAGASLETLSPVLLLVGAAAQLATGALGALVVRGLRRLGAILLAPRPPGARRVTDFPLPRRPERAPRSTARAAASARAPPFAAVA